MDEDVNIKFMHNNLPTHSLRCPTRDDVCHVPRTHICTIETPSLLTRRQYVLNSTGLKKIEIAIDSYKENQWLTTLFKIHFSNVSFV